MKGVKNTLAADLDRRAVPRSLRPPTYPDQSRKVITGQGYAPGVRFGRNKTTGIRL
jgi:hypothetical protein